MILRVEGTRISVEYRKEKENHREVELQVQVILFVGTKDE